MAAGELKVTIISTSTLLYVHGTAAWVLVFEPHPPGGFEERVWLLS